MLYKKQRHNYSETIRIAPCCSIKKTYLANVISHKMKNLSFHKAKYTVYNIGNDKICFSVKTSTNNKTIQTAVSVK